MTTWLANRYSNLSTFNAVAINYSTLTGTTITVTSTMVSLGASTNQTYTALSKGNFTSTSNWVTSLTGRTSTIGVSMSANALTQLVVSQSSSTTSIQYTSTLGASWSTLSNASGLPSSLTTSYSAGAISGDGKYGVLGTTTGQLFVTSNAGASWTNSGTIWTNTIPYAPVVYLPFENSLNDVSGNGKNGVATGTITYVPGIVGKNAVYIQNTPGAAVPTSYIRGVANSWTVPTRFTISFWFNAPILNGTIQILFCALTLGIQIYIQSNNTVVIAIPSGTSTNYVNISSSVISANTWYYITLLYQANGTSSFYLNNQLMGTVTSTGLGTHPQSNIYSLGSYDAAVSGGFNGYIDDLKIYNNMVTYSAPVLANFSNVAISNSGQYMLASATGAGLYLSSDYGATFSPVTGAMLSALWTAAQVSASGQYMLANSPVVMVQPQLTGLNANTWQTNGVTWNTSGSSFTSQNWYYRLFNGFPSPYSTAIATATNYSAASPGLYTGSTSTSVIGQGTVNGDYFQIQSSIQLQIQSYTFYSAGYWQFPNTYTIAGSNDGSTWYLLQSVTMNQNPCGTTVAGNYAVSSTNIIINQSGTQTMTTFNFSTTTSISSAILTCTASAYSANAYTYFRLIVPTIWNNQTPYVATQAALGQWIINFQAGGQTYSTNYGLTWNNGYALYSGQTQLPSYSQPTISPQLTGLAASTWQTNGITWTVSASDINPGTYSPYLAFNNVSSASNTFATPATYTPSTGAYTGSKSTNIQGTPYLGEWLQLQSSVPLIMFSYSTAMGGSTDFGNQAPDTYQIVGSNDGSIWYTIQTASRATGNPYGAIYGGTSTILVNNPGTITVTGTSGTPSATYTIATTSYTTTPFLYFRMCVNKIIPTLFGSLELGEWYINFRLPSLTNATTTYPSTTLSLSESGQTALSTTISNPVLLAELNFEGSAPAAYADSVGGLTYIGTYFSTGTIGISTVQKVVGSSSLLIAGITAGQAGSNSYVSYSLPPSFATLGNLFSISAWIRPTVLSGNVAPFSLGAGPSATMIDMYISSSGIVNIQFFTTSTPTDIITFSSITTIVANTWSHIACVVGNGIIYLYVNGSLQNTQSYTGTLCVQTTRAPAPYFYVGCGVGVYNQFVGYIDNLRIYNSALPPQQIQTIYANNVSSTTLTQLVPSFSVSPQQTGLASNTWSQGGVAWTVSTSSILAGLYYPYYLFDNTNYTRWVAVSITYTTSGNSSGIFTTILGGIGSIQGDWVQLQTSVPLVMSSYQFANGYANQRLPKTYYIIGSNDGTNWYPVQYGSGGTVPAIDQYTLIPSTIIVNSSSTQTFGSGSIVTTIYPTTTTAYLYFRLVCVTNYSSSGDYIDIGGWNVTFTGPPNTSLYNVVSPLTNFSTGSSVSTGTIPGIITGSAVSTTGQYMVVVTNNTSGNNVYYSTNTGATFTGLQLGSSPMTSCAISYDGTYITVSNATTVYTLNNNSTGYSVAIGNQAGQQNQAVNAIAIGNYAGYQNQTANSIILNATGSTVNSVAQGFYVAPIASYTASSSQTFSLLGYGIGTGGDNQIVQLSPIITLSDTTTGTILTFNGSLSATGTIYGANTGTGAAFWMPSNGATSFYITDNQSNPKIGTTTFGRYFGVAGNIFQDFYGSFLWRSSNLLNTAVDTVMTLSTTNNVGTNSPTSVLQVVGTVTASTFLTTISSINTLPPINVRSIAATAPAVYLFSLTTTVLTINNPSDYARAIIYVSISSTGVIMQNVLVSVGIQINSYSAGQLSYNVGYSGNTVYTGGDSIVSLTRFL